MGRVKTKVGICTRGLPASIMPLNNEQKGYLFNCNGKTVVNYYCKLLITPLFFEKSKLRLLLSALYLISEV
jgi:hypothetical protein